MGQPSQEYIDCVTAATNAYLARLQQLIEERDAALEACEEIADLSERIKCIDAAIANHAAGTSSAYFTYVLARQKCEGGCGCG